LTHKTEKSGTDETAASGGSVGADEKWENALSFRWHVTAFAAIFAFIALMLWGVYVPSMRHLSSEAMKTGDKYRDRAIALKSDSAVYQREIEELDARINKIYPVVAIFFEWTRTGGGSMDPNDPLNHGLVQGLKDAEQEIRGIDEFALEFVKGKGLNKDFQFLFDRLAARAKNVDQRLTATVGQPLDPVHYSEAYYSGLCYTALPDLLTTTKKIRDLFSTEACFDQAMAEYIDAIGYSRTWSTPRLHMADLYRARDWPEFAMMEYLRVIKLDPKGADGKKAFDQLKIYLGQHGEADFHVALAYLIFGDKSAATTHLRNFLDRAPTNVLAPKAAEVLSHLEQGHDVFIKQYLRDEIWI
jgi:tetratricopeptide (TPR) repeat protein